MHKNNVVLSITVCVFNLMIAIYIQCDVGFLFQLCWFADVWQLLIKVGTMKAKQRTRQRGSIQNKTLAPQTDDKWEEEEEGKKNR